MGPPESPSAAGRPAFYAEHSSMTASVAGDDALARSTSSKIHSLPPLEGMRISAALSSSLTRRQPSLTDSEINGILHTARQTTAAAAAEDLSSTQLMAAEDDLRRMYGNLQSFVPKIVLQKVEVTGRPLVEPVATPMKAAVLFTDITGFTRLTESLTSQGPQGVELLSATLSSYFGTVIDLIHRHGGDVIKFAGDALISIWPSSPTRDLTSASMLATQCALECLKINARYRESDSELANPEEKRRTPSYLLSILRNSVITKTYKTIEDDSGSVTSSDSVKDLQRANSTGLDPPTIVLSGGGSGNSGSEHKSEHKSFGDKSSSAGFVDLDVEREKRKLQLHCAVAAGSMFGVHLGSDDRWEFLLAGDEVLSQMSAGLSAAQKGDLVVSPGVWTLISKFCSKRNYSAVSNVSMSTAHHDDDDAPRSFVHVVNVQHPVPLPVVDQFSQFESTPARVVTKLRVRALTLYVPQAVRHALDVGQGEWMAELRRCSILFVQLPNVSFEAPHAVHVLHNLYLVIRKAIVRYEGTLRQLIHDDKGFVAILVFGTPPDVHEDDPLRAVKAALDIHGDMLTMNPPMQCSIGCTTGRVFCGAVGSVKRREFAIVGDVVNLAARLMANAKLGILCDRATHAATKDRIAYTRLADIHVKGKAAAVEVFRPQQALEQNPLDARLRFLAGRDKEQGILQECMQRVTAFQGPSNLQSLMSLGSIGDKSDSLGAVIFTGEAGMGKSALLEYAGGVSRNLSLRTLSTKCDPLHQKTPYYVWNQVLRQALRLENSDSEIIEQRLADLFANMPASSASLTGSRAILTPASQQQQQQLPGQLQGAGSNDASGLTSPLSASRAPSTQNSFSSSRVPGASLANIPKRSSSEVVTVRSPNARRLSLMRQGSGLQNLSSQPKHLLCLLNDVLDLNFEATDAAQSMSALAKADATCTLICAILSSQLPNARSSSAGMAKGGVLLMDDIHLMDSASLKALWVVARRVKSLLIIASMRPMPEVPTEIKQILRHPGTESLTLAALDSDAVSELVAEHLNVNSLPDEIDDIIRSKSHGNPFFATEMASALRDDQVLIINEDTGTCRLADGVDLEAITFTDSVEAVITQRINQLPAEAQFSLKVASVVGSMFSVGTLRRVHPIEGAAAKIGDHLRLCTNLDLITSTVAATFVTRGTGGDGRSPSVAIVASTAATPRPGQSRRASMRHSTGALQTLLMSEIFEDGESTFLFTHDVVREVAYNLLLFSQRQQLHSSIAEHLRAAYDAAERVATRLQRSATVDRLALLKEAQEAVRIVSLESGDGDGGDGSDGDGRVQPGLVVSNENGVSMGRKRRPSRAIITQVVNHEGGLVLPSDDKTTIGNLAHHYMRAGKYEDAITFLEMAGQLSEKTYANEEAAKFYMLALEAAQLGTDLSIDRVRMGGWHVAIGNALLTRGHGGKALEHLRAALQLYGHREPRTRIGVIASLIKQLAVQAKHRMRHDAASSPAGNPAMADSGRKAALLSTAQVCESLATVYYVQSDTLRSVYSMLRSTNVADEIGGGMRYRNYAAMSVVSLLAGLPKMSDMYFRLGWEEGIVLNRVDASSVPYVMMACGIKQAAQGNLALACSIFEQGWEAAKEVGDGRRAGELCAHLAETHALLGSIIEARDFATWGLESGEERDDNQVMLWCAASSATLAVRYGPQTGLAEDETLSSVDRSLGFVRSIRTTAERYDLFTINAAAAVLTREWEFAALACELFVKMDATLFTSQNPISALLSVLWWHVHHTEGEPRRTAVNAVRTVMKRFRKHSKTFAAMRPSVLRFEAYWDLLHGRAAKARRTLFRAMAAARELEMGHEECLAMFELERQYPESEYEFDSAEQMRRRNVDPAYFAEMDKNEVPC